MGATYTRQSTYTDGDTITASDTNNEFDQLGVKRNTFGRCLRTPQQIPKEYLSYVAIPSKSRIKSAASRK